MGILTLVLFGNLGLAIVPFFFFFVFLRERERDVGYCNVFVCLFVCLYVHRPTLVSDGYECANRVYRGESG